MTLRLLGYLMVGAAAVIVFIVFYSNSKKSDVPLIFAPSQVLAATWIEYKNIYIEKNSYRTLDTSRENVTTSEGQSYSMLRAVWMDDKSTFDGVWGWTQKYLQHSDDHLFAWEWGLMRNGSYGIVTEQSGQNSASDADTDIALSLV